MFEGWFARMNRRSVVLKLRRAIGSEGQALLGSFNLLQPLLKQMLICEAMADVPVSQEQLQQGQSAFSTSTVMSKWSSGLAAGDARAK